ncbi:MAG: SGNH/GDSL hydrolase family protein [Acholeplasmataceae bacterium]
MRGIEDLKRLIQMDYERKVKRFMTMPECQVVIVGDSMVDYFKPKANVCLQGIAGDTSIGVKARIESIKHVKPKRVIIHVGTNDLVLTELSINETIEHLKDIQQNLSPIETFFCTPIPVDEHAMDANNHLRTNEKLSLMREIMIASISAEFIIDLYPLFYENRGLPETLHVGDGLHLNDKGYEIYEHAMYPFIKEYIDE